MRALILLHRWLGVAFCLLFAMWFASGIVMHFVPFPAFTEADRIAGLATLDLGRVERGPALAVSASGLHDATRVRLTQRSDGPVYVVSNLSAVKAVRTSDLADGAVRTDRLALAIALDYARHRRLDSVEVANAGSVSYDQWTVAQSFDPHRPLHRVTLGDSRGTELYVSSATGEVVLATTRRERAWNYVGSVAHWIYPAVLRHDPALWARLVWWISLLALVGAAAGAVIGTLRIGIGGARPVSPYRGVQAWHHWLGLTCMLFVLSWIFSGWLSMDDGHLFSTGEPDAAETMTISGTPTWDALPPDEISRVAPTVTEVEWIAFGGHLYRRERAGAAKQQLFRTGTEAAAGAGARSFLRPDEIAAAARGLGRACGAPMALEAGDDYATASSMPAAPVYRLVCGADWFDIDGASGVLLEKLDASRRAYHWLYGGLHRLDFPVLTARPALRTALIVVLCGCGFIFSLTGIVIAWRRLWSCIRAPE